MSDMQTIIEQAFERRADITPRSAEAQVKEAVMEAISMLDSGTARVAEKKDGLKPSISHARYRVGFTNCAANAECNL